jgi:hypothetical protein
LNALLKEIGVSGSVLVPAKGGKAKAKGLTPKKKAAAR